MKVVVTGGGTGGHVYPALAIIDNLRLRDRNLEILYIGTTNRMESKLIPSLGINYLGIEMIGINRKNIFSNFKLPFLLLKNKFKLKKLFKDFAPNIVIGTGGYVTVPVIAAASSCNIPTLIFDADYHFGKATSYLKNRASCVCTSYKKNCYDSHIIFTGNPRGQYVYEKTNRDSISNKALFVFGSLGSNTMNDFFLEYFNNNELSYDVKYVTGKGHYKDFVSKLTNRRVSVCEYIDDITKELADVKFVVCRGGATSVSELIACEIPAIYVPSPYVANNEQYYNVIDLIKEDVSLMIEEKDLTFNEFKKAEYQITNDYDYYKSNIKKISVKNSCDLVVENVFRLVGKNE